MNVTNKIGNVREVNLLDVSIILVALGFFLLPFSTDRSSGLVFSPGYLLLYPGSIILLFSSRRRSINSLKYWLILPICLMFLLPITYSILSPNILTSVWRAVSYIFGLFIIIGLISLPDHIEKNSIIIKLIETMTVTTSVYYIINFVIQSMKYGLSAVAIDRVSGGLAELPWGASNVVAGVLFLGLLAIIHRQFFNSVKYGNNFYIFLVSLAIVLTFSRTVIISMLTIFAFILIIRKSKSIFSVIMIIVASGYSAYQYSSAETRFILQQLLNDRINYQEISTANGRQELWIESYNIYLSNSGPSGYYSNFLKLGHSAHNLYLSTLIEQGILGLVVLLLVIFSLIWYCIYYKQYFISFQILILAISLNFEDLFYCQQYILLFSLIIAYILTIKGNKNGQSGYSNSELEYRGRTPHSNTTMLRSKAG